MIAPEVIAADSNVRFGLLETRVDKLADDILRDGQINDAMEVEELPEPVDGCLYRVTVGHYRHAAALKVNKTQNAGLECPCIVKNRGDEKERLVRQVSENNDRQNFTPMDSAVAIKQMMDAGIPRMDIMKAFSRPNVKGKLAPASNSFLNMMVSFLELPKPIQRKIHEGFLGVYEAYQLTKAPKDDREEILARAEKARLAEFNWEDKMQAQFEAAERKAAEAKEKEDKLKAEAEAARAKSEEKLKVLKELQQKAIKAFEAHKVAEDEEAKKKLAEEFKATDAESKKAEQDYSSAVKAAKRAEEKVTPAEQVRKKQQADLKAKKDAAEKEKQTKQRPTRQNIEKATQEVVNKTFVPLNAKEIKEIVFQLALPNGDAPKVQEIGKLLKRTFFGEDDQLALLTPTELMTGLKAITGEGKAKAARK